MTVHNQLTLYHFYREAAERAQRTHERLGQAIFNHLAEVRPELSEQVRGTDKDPFYVALPSDDPQWDRFVTFLVQNWGVAQ